MCNVNVHILLISNVKNNNKLMLIIMANIEEEEVETDQSRKSDNEEVNANWTEESNPNIKTYDPENVEDEENFKLYIKVNFEAFYEKFTQEKTSKCYYCDFCLKDKNLLHLE